MASAAISRSIIIVFGLLYPAYNSYKAIKTRSVQLYVKWMIYWIVFALFHNVETIADLVISWFPMYYELKIIFVIWLLSPATQGSDVLYRMYIHPHLLKHEQEIEQTLEKVKSQSYTTLFNVGAQGMSFALKGAIAGQTKLADQLRKSYSFDETDSTQNNTDMSNIHPQLLYNDDIIFDEDDVDDRIYQRDYRIANRFQAQTHARQMPTRNIEQPYTQSGSCSPTSIYPERVSRRDRHNPGNAPRQHVMTRSLPTRDDNFSQHREDNSTRIRSSDSNRRLVTSHSTPGLSQTSRRVQKPVPKATIARPVTRNPTPSSKGSNIKVKAKSGQQHTSDDAGITKTTSDKPKTKPRFTESTLRYRTKKISDIKSYKIESPFLSML